MYVWMCRRYAIPSRICRRPISRVRRSDERGRMMVDAVAFVAFARTRTWHWKVPHVPPGGSIKCTTIFPGYHGACASLLPTILDWIHLTDNGQTKLQSYLSLILLQKEMLYHLPIYSKPTPDRTIRKRGNPIAARLL